MKILAIADRPPREKLSKLIQENSIELFCSLGDLNYFYLQDLEEIIDIPKVGVYGNHCSGTYFDSLGIMDLHLKTFEHKGLTFGGFEGSIKYKESDYAKMYTQQEASEKLKGFPYVDVMIAHSPPFGINDESDTNAHQGFVGLKEYIEEKKPKYFLHGHTYPTEANIVKKYLETKIIYVHEDVVIEL